MFGSHSTDLVFNRNRSWFWMELLPSSESKNDLYYIYFRKCNISMYAECKIWVVASIVDLLIIYCHFSPDEGLRSKTRWQNKPLFFFITSFVCSDPLMSLGLLVLSQYMFFIYCWLFEVAPEQSNNLFIHCRAIQWSFLVFELCI